MSLPALIEVQATDTIESAAARVTLKPDVIILLFGSFDSTQALQVRSILTRALGPIALVSNALIVTNGSSEGLAALMGQAAQQLDQPPLLLGILEPNVVGPDPNHTAVLRLPADWSDPSKSSFLLLAELAKSEATVQRPVVPILVGGGDAEKLTLLRCARHCWPILAVKGAGGLADAVLAAKALPAEGAQAAEIADPDLREILDTATICPLAIDGGADDLKRVLLGPIQKPGDVLVDAWGRYDDLDVGAGEKQSLFKLTQIAILTLAMVATLLAIVVTGTPLPMHLRISHRVVHVLLILVPITTSMLVGFNSRFREGNKWILLRTAAESIKREIFRYRTRAGIYSEEQCTQTSAQLKLAASMKEISSNLVQSEVNRSSLPHRAVADPSRLRFLQPEEYVRERVEDQVNYFVLKTGSLYRRLKRLQMLILIAGGVGTFLAAVGFDVWVALTTALATAVTSKLEIDQVENSLVQYNIALTNLRNINSWWRALSPWEKTRRKNIDLLVDQTEMTLERETAGWIQQMQSTLDKLTEKQPGADHGDTAPQRA
ncbi:MAG TPA: DUF4231 domain-containing protein [Acidisarcina sp.]